jgi:hypothetical protein
LSTAQANVRQQIVLLNSETFRILSESFRRPVGKMAHPEIRYHDPAHEFFHTREVLPPNCALQFLMVTCNESLSA